MERFEMGLPARAAGTAAVMLGIAALAAGCADHLLLAVSGLITSGAGALMLHRDRRLMRVLVSAHTSALEQANQQLRHEIGARVALKGALEASQKRIEDILSILPMPVIVKDSRSNIQLMNRASEEKWGMRLDQVVGTAGASHIPPSIMQAVLEEDRAVFAAGVMVVGESTIWNSLHGCAFELESYKKPMYDERGEPQALVCVYVDITQRKRADQALQRSFLQLRALAAELELLKEEDRRRIAKGIHDDLGQNLLALKIDVQMLHACASARHPRLRRRVGQVLDTIDATIGSVRAIMNDLHPSTLELGLPVALEWLVEQFEKRSGIRCTLSVTGDEAPLTDKRRTAAMFRIVQEALLQVLSHAQASRVDVTLAYGVEQLAITIDDDGGGVDLGDHSGQRLRALRERVDVFGGGLGIECVAAGGTRLSIFIPTAAAMAAKR